jgi:hypothetical protein
MTIGTSAFFLVKDGLLMDVAIMSTPRCPNEFIFNLIIRIGQLATTESTGRKDQSFKHKTSYSRFAASLIMVEFRTSLL